MSERNIQPLGTPIQCGIDIDERTNEKDGANPLKQFVELMRASRGEDIAGDIILSRREAVGGIKDIADPPQALLDLVQTIIERYRAGEWAVTVSDGVPEIRAASSSGSSGSQEPGLNGMDQLDKSQLHREKSVLDVNKIYYEGSLLWAMTLSPDRKKIEEEHYQGEEFTMAQAIDAFLENATEEEIAAFNELDKKWTR